MIWITQWLCPSRHCVFGFAWDSSGYTRLKVEEMGQGFIDSGAINKNCGLCGQPVKPEHGRTRFRTMEEAKPDLARLQAENLRARDLLNPN